MFRVWREPKGGIKKIRKQLIGLLTLFMLLMPMLPMAFAAPDGNSSGTAVVGNADPVINNVYLTDVSDVSKNGAQIDVWTTYLVTATITDNNKLSHLHNITIKIWEDVAADEGSADADANHYTFTYTEGTDTWAEVGPDAGGSHLVSGSCADPADHNDVSGNFTLGFKLAKTGARTDTATWDIAIYVYDESDATDNDKTLTFGVNFYAELTVTDSTHGWTSVAAGSTDNLMDDPDGDLDISVTCNDTFDVQVKAAAANLVSGGNTIAVGNITVHEDTLGSSIPLTTNYADVVGLTGESAGADQAKSFKLWIDIPAGQTPGSYTYTLNIQIIEA